MRPRGIIIIYILLGYCIVDPAAVLHFCALQTTDCVLYICIYYVLDECS